MITVKETDELLALLGGRLRQARLGRNETQALFSERIGVSIPTLRDMENGRDTVQIGHWLRALWALNRLSDMQDVLSPRTPLIEQARQKRQPGPKRASRKRRA